MSHGFAGWRPALPEAVGRRLENNPDGYSFISRNVTPCLRELGVSEAECRTSAKVGHFQALNYRRGLGLVKAPMEG